MRDSRLYFQWQKNSVPSFRTAVSLHGHTLHSRESLDFIERATANTPWLSGAARKHRAKYLALTGRELDLKRAWWTPPLSARQAWDLEKAQIENTLGLEALVSISDHDNIDAGINLHALDEMRDCPISIEWTIPFRRTFFHLGVHNLPVNAAKEMTRAMNEFTVRGRESGIAAMLEWLGSAPQSLVVFNHPVFDENHIGDSAHMEYVSAFIDSFGHFLHAIELNGLRSWRENRKASQLAARYGLPLISGGDRHGREPNACLNPTNASTFAEFVEEVRRDGWSNLLFMPQYREPLRMRVFENIRDVLEDNPTHALGWTRWHDRVFYRTDEGIEQSLTEFVDSQPISPAMDRLVWLMGLSKHRRVKSALRLALNAGAEREPAYPNLRIM
jgi:hypothetical protein